MKQIERNKMELENQKALYSGVTAKQQKRLVPLRDVGENRRRAIMVAMWSAISAKLPTWQHQYGGVNDSTIYSWSGALADFSEEQIRRGMDSVCNDWMGDFPPTFPQFKKLCLTVSYANNVTEQRIISAKAAIEAHGQLTKPRPGDSDIARREKGRMRRILAGEEVETKEESMRKLGLHVRWGT